MANYAKVSLDEIEDTLGDYPGDMKPMKNPLDRPEDAEILLISNRMDPDDHVDKVQNFWPK